MNNEDKCFNYLEKIWSITTIKGAKKYLENIKKEFSSLNKKDRKKYLAKIHEYCYLNYMDEFFLKENQYELYNSKKSIREIIISQFRRLDLQNFDLVIDEVLEFLEPITIPYKTKRLFKKDVELVFKTINKKIPDFGNIMQNIKINILLLNNSHKYLNSLIYSSQNLKNFNIVCFYMKNNDEYQSGMLNPIYVFLHEIGHIICFLITNEFGKVPLSFFPYINKYMDGLTIDNPDTLEVFADSFAMAIMYNTSLDCYNPFTKFKEEFFIDLEKYFKETIPKIEVLNNDKFN